MRISSTGPVRILVGTAAMIAVCECKRASDRIPMSNTSLTPDEARIEAYDGCCPDANRGQLQFQKLTNSRQKVEPFRSHTGTGITTLRDPFAAKASNAKRGIYVIYDRFRFMKLLSLFGPLLASGALLRNRD